MKIVRPRRLLGTLLLCGIAATAAASPREDAVEIFESIPAGWESAALDAYSKGGPGTGLEETRNEVSLGEEHRYGFGSASDAHLVAVHLDAHGVATVLLPEATPDSGRILAGTPAHYPAESDLVLRAEPPLGREDVFVFATREAVSLEDLGFPAGTGVRPIVDSVDVVDFAERVRGVLAAIPPESVASARIRSRVVGRAIARVRGTESVASGPAYTVQDVVGYFTSPRTRSIHRTVLDVQIQFALDSAELSDDSRRNLDVVGQALAGEALGDRVFEVGGHTCDLGPEAYNLDLSRRRAATVQHYLSEAHAIDPERLAVRAYGESRPLEVGASESIRQRNRRVEFALVRAE